MTYQEFISRISDEVRDNAWPEPDTSVTEEQLEIAFAAVQSLATQLPIYTLDKDSATLAGSGAKAGNGYLSYNLPDDLFESRDDLGIYHHTFDSVEHDPSESVPINTLRMVAGNDLYGEDDGLFSINGRDKTLNILSTDSTKDVTLSYVPKPTEPKNTTGSADSYDTLEVPLPDSEIQSLVHAVAAHINGSRLRDGAGAQFQSILSNNYKSILPPQQPE